MSDSHKSDPAVVVDGVSKTFKIPLEASSGIKQKLINTLKGRKGYREFSPLDDISFTVNKGDFFGIVGRNGSGKSTLLKTIAGIYTPSKGSVYVDGTLVPFIELGVGFNPELTGRENIYLNGALLGFSHTEVEAMYDEIVDFAELHDFMEERLKNYSSGMQVRLAFSIAIKAQGDVLLLDEVLAVGDAAFQQKCNDYFEQQKARGQTIILVTHDMASVEKYCTKALLLESGKVTMIGKPEQIASAYTNLNQQSTSQQLGSPEVQYDGMKMVIKDGSGQMTQSFNHGEKMSISFSWDNPNIKNIGVALYRQSGERMFATNTEKDKYSLTGNKCTYELELPVAPGKYYLRIRAYGKSELETVALIEDGPLIYVKSVDHKVDGFVSLGHEWKDEA